MLDLNNKGDYMRAVLKIDSSIKEIDSAIPYQISVVFRNYGLDTSNLCMVYFKDRSQKILDIISYYYIQQIKKNKEV